jgi:hypothetical protein
MIVFLALRGARYSRLRRRERSGICRDGAVLAFPLLDQLLCRRPPERHELSVSLALGWYGDGGR